MFDTQVLVVGSGVGGAITGCVLAEAGLEVLIVEEGPDLPLDSCEPFSRDEMLQKYRCGGITVALGPAPIAYVEGRCCGGGSEINSGLYHRVPEEVVGHWRAHYGLADTDSLPTYFDIAERDVCVGPLPVTPPAASLRLYDGARALGWRAIEVPRWYRYDKSGSGRKQSMTETYLPRARRAGARIESASRVLKLRPERSGWTASVLRGGALHRVHAETVFVCAGAIQSAALLRRSGLAGGAGATLRMHPTLKVAALFDDPVNAPGMGVPVHQVKEFSPDLSLGCSVSSLPYLYLALLDVAAGGSIVASSWQHMAIYYAMVREGVGRVDVIPGLSEPLVRFSVGESGLACLLEGMVRLCECLFAAGARTLYPSVLPGVVVTSMAQARRLAADLRASQLALMTIHLMGTCPMGERTGCCVVDSYGRVHGHRGLFVNDASILPTALGVNPQGSIMAFALRNASAFVDGSKGPA